MEYVYIVRLEGWQYEKPVLHKVEVLKRSAKQVITSRGEGTRFAARHDVVSFDEMYLPTPERAVSLWRLSTETQIALLEGKIKDLRAQMEIEPQLSTREQINDAEAMED